MIVGGIRRLPSRGPQLSDRRNGEQKKPDPIENRTPIFSWVLGTGRARNSAPSGVTVNRRLVGTFRSQLAACDHLKGARSTTKEQKIDQRIFDLYDEYCHGRMDRREFLGRAAAIAAANSSSITSVASGAPSTRFERYRVLMAKNYIDNLSGGPPTARRPTARRVWCERMWVSTASSAYRDAFYPAPCRTLERLAIDGRSAGPVPTWWNRTMPPGSTSTSPPCCDVSPTGHLGNWPRTNSLK